MAAHDGGRQPVVRAALAAPARTGGGNPRRPRAGGRPAHALSRPLSFRTLGRAAAARRHRPLPGRAAGADAVRRTAQQPRRCTARGHADRDDGTGAARGRHSDLCDARPGRGHGRIGPHRRDARRPHRPVRHAAGDLRAAGRFLRRRLHRRLLGGARHGPGRHVQHPRRRDRKPAHPRRDARQGHAGGAA